MSVVIVALILAVLLPALARARHHTKKITCVTLMKQIGLAFRVWSGDHQDLYPMSLGTNSGGTAELSSDAWRTFQVLSNELDSLKVLVCFADTNRIPAKSWSVLSNTNISYFVCLEADEVRPDVVLAGDRNLTNGLATTNRVLTVSSNTPVSWTDELHHLAGNLLLSDGSVQQFGGGPRLQQAIHGSLRSYYEAATNSTLRLAMPE